MALSNGVRSPWSEMSSVCGLPWNVPAGSKQSTIKRLENIYHVTHGWMDVFSVIISQLKLNTYINFVLKLSMYMLGRLILYCNSNIDNSLYLLKASLFPCSTCICGMGRSDGYVGFTHGRIAKTSQVNINFLTFPVSLKMLLACLMWVLLIK